MQLDGVDVYNFFFHPLSRNHSDEVRGFSIFTNLVLTILSGGLYLLVFTAVHAREYVILQDQNTGLNNHKATDIFRKHFPFSNATTEYIDIPTLQKKRRDLLPKLTDLATHDDWQHIQRNTSHPDSHFDAIMFPTTQPTASGQYRLRPQHVEILKQNEEFMDTAHAIVDLVARSYGWDLDTNDHIASPKQKWLGSYDRLTNMLRFVTEFGLTEKYKQLLTFIDDHDIQHLDSTPQSLLVYLQPIL